MIRVTTQILDAGDHHRLQHPHFSSWICLSSGSKYTLCISASIETHGIQGITEQMCSPPHVLYTYMVKGIKRKTSDDFYLQI
jgi:hypothetical protein